MEYQIAYHTDIGIKKNTNQDALLIKVARTPIGNVTFAVICDGMGGLSKGELASSEVIRRCSDWFTQELPLFLYSEDIINILRSSWERLIWEENQKLTEYGRRNGINLGTTLTAVLMLKEFYYVIHIGDCRLYECSDALYQITKDQTVVAKEVERGNLSLEQAKMDPRRNVLLQCIGATEEIVPEFIVGQIKPNVVYLLCSDGFRHEISSEEIWNCFSPGKYGRTDMKKKQVALVEEIKKRGETDNISVLTIKTA